MRMLSSSAATRLHRVVLRGSAFGELCYSAYYKMGRQGYISPGPLEHIPKGGSEKGGQVPKQKTKNTQVLKKSHILKQKSFFWDWEVEIRKPEMVL